MKRKEKFRVKIDTSEHVIRRVLSQEQEGKWKPITFLSRIIQLAKRNYLLGTDQYYETKKYRKIFPYMLVKEHYFISLWQKEEGT